jgi:flavin reductase (DIM6/NTAB) family NADH-FMN oxidoreductase RutF
MEDSFKDAMSYVPSSVSIISVGSGEMQAACTISSLISVDVEDPTVLFALRNDSSTLKAIHSQKTFSINVLAQNQSSLAVEYSLSNKKIDQNLWTENQFRTLTLADSRVFLICEMDKAIKLESSTLVLSKVLDFHISKICEPLLYSNREYKKLAN